MKIRHQASDVRLQQPLWMVIAVGIGCASASSLAAAEVDHAVWDGLLKRHVKETRIDYQGLMAERDALEGYLKSLRAATPGQGSREAQLAFWINAYNACVVQGVLERYPTTSVKRIRGFFDGLQYPVAGEEVTLNGIEAKGRALGDARIHYAVVCASSSCPFIRNEAYAPERLEEQLADQARRFLNDPQRGIRVDGSLLWASKIFDWYAEDFLAAAPGAPRQMTAQTLLAVVKPSLGEALAQAGQRPSLALKFMPYDWSLNDARRSP